MTSKVFAPFQFIPQLTEGGSGNYTVPAGKYALVRINVSGVASMYSDDTLVDNRFDNPTDSFSESFEIWMKAGDVLSSSTTAQTNTTAVGALTTFSSTASVDVAVNSNSIGFFAAQATITLDSGNCLRNCVAYFRRYVMEFDLPT